MDLTLAAHGATGLLERVLEDAPVGMALSTWDDDDQIRFLHVNRALTEITGRDREELLAAEDPVALITHPDDLAACRDISLRIARGEETECKVEKRYLRPDGSVAWGLVHLALFPGAEPGRTLALALITDITAQKQAEWALRQSREQLNLIVETTTSLVFVKDLEGRYQMVNPRFLDVIGRREEDVIGRTDRELFPADVAAAAEAGDRKVLEADGVVEMDDAVPVGEASAFPTVKFPLRDAQGRPVAVGGVATDISERLAGEEQLRRSQARLAEAHAIAGIGMWDWYPDEGLGYWSDELYRIFGLKPQRLPANVDLFLERVHPLDREHAGRELARTITQGVPMAFETRIVTPDGRVRTVQLRGRAVEDGPRRRFSGVVQDVTELASARRELERIRARNELILDSAGEGICGVDRDGVITFVNRTAARMLGWRPDDLVGRPFHETVQHSRRDESPQPPEESCVLATLTRGIANRREDEYMWRRDGTSFHAACTSMPLEEQGEIVGAVVTFSDMTERLRAREADRLDSIASLAAGAAHEFNNQLAVVMSYAAVLEAELRDREELRAHASEISKAADHAADLTHQLLLFGRQEMTPPEPLDLADLVREMTPLLRRLAGEGVDLRLVLDDVRPVKLARPRAEEVLINLTVNARDAMPEGGVLTIAVANALASPEAFEPAGGIVRLSIRDSGPGIAPEVARRAFEPFFTTKPRGQGTGLGLATVHGVVTEAGGEVSIRAMRGGGTAVEILLPATSLPPVSAPPRKPRPRRSPVPATVLLVEDREPLRRLLARVLREHGHTVLEAGEGPSALATACRKLGSIDVLVTDVVLPGMSGRELRRCLDEQQPGLRTIYMTGHAPELVADRPDDALVLAKPFDPQRLADAVARVLT